MADQNFAQMVLSLLNRPGNAVRGALIDGPEGFGRGLSDQQQYDGTQLPGINQLPDEGPQLGPIHVTPRTVGGFAGSTLLDPLTYAGGLFGKIGGGAVRGLGLAAEDMPQLSRLGSLGDLTGADARSAAVQNAFDTLTATPGGTSPTAHMGMLDPSLTDFYGPMNAPKRLDPDYMASIGHPDGAHFAPQEDYELPADFDESQAFDGHVERHIPGQLPPYPVEELTDQPWHQQQDYDDFFPEPPDGTPYSDLHNPSDAEGGISFQALDPGLAAKLSQFQGGITHPHFGPDAALRAKQALQAAKLDPMTSPIEDLVAHHGEGYSIADDAAEAGLGEGAQVPQGRDGKYGPELRDYDARQSGGLYTHTVKNPLAGAPGYENVPSFEQRGTPIPELPSGVRTAADQQLHGNPNRMSQDPQHLVENATGRMGLDPAQNGKGAHDENGLPAGDTGYEPKRMTTLAPGNEVTPVGDQRQALMQDKLGKQLSGELDPLYRLRDQIKQYLDMVGGPEGVGVMGAGGERTMDANGLQTTLAKVLSDIEGAEGRYKTNKDLMAQDLGERRANQTVSGYKAEGAVTPGEAPTVVGDEDGDVLPTRSPGYQSPDQSPVGDERKSLLNTTRSQKPGLSPAQEDLAQKRGLKQASLQVKQQTDPEARYYNGAGGKLDSENYDPAATIINARGSGMVNQNDGTRMNFQQYQSGLQREQTGGGAGITPDERDTLAGAKDDELARNAELSRMTRPDPLYSQLYDEMPGMSHSDSVDQLLEDLAVKHNLADRQPNAPGQFRADLRAGIGQHSFGPNIEPGLEFERLLGSDNIRDFTSPQEQYTESLRKALSEGDGRDPGAEAIRYSPGQKTYAELVSKLTGDKHQPYTSPTSGLREQVAATSTPEQLIALADSMGMHPEDLLRLLRGPAF